jgi:putative phosphoesterase
MLIAVVSDTHHLLRPELLVALREVGPAHILHAGDVGDAAILDALAEIAPVTAIRGNTDTHGPCAELPATEAVELGGCLLYMLHDVHELDVNPRAAQIAVVISGHSHQPSINTRDGVLYLNPGSAGPRRFALPVTFATLQVEDGLASAEVVNLAH